MMLLIWYFKAIDSASIKQYLLSNYLYSLNKEIEK